MLHRSQRIPAGASPPSTTTTSSTPLKPLTVRSSRPWRRTELVLTTLALALFASDIFSGATSSATAAAAATTATREYVKEEVEGAEGNAPWLRKEFPASRLHELLKDLFQKRRSELWEGMFHTSATAEGGRGRHRRQAEEEKRLLSLMQEDRLGTFVGEVMACQNIPGLSLGMTRGGARQGQGYGVADMETGRPVDKDTLFGIGSNTKAFAAASLAHLMVTLPMDKRFSFSTPLAELVEDLQLRDLTRTEQTTLMDVLSHRTGLASADLGIFSGYPLNLTTEDFCKRLQFLPEMLPFRSAWYYSNTMYVLVSRVCEARAGQNLTEVLEEAIWRPLQMNDTGLTPEALSRENVALPYILRMRVYDMFVQQDPTLFDIHPMQAAGAVMSSAMDMTKWLAHLLNVIKRPQGVAMSVLRQLFTERTLLPAYLRQLAGIETVEPILHIGYGMGFMSSYYKGHMVYWHTGDFHGYNSMVLVVPDLDTAVYVAVNGPSGPTTGKAVLHTVYFVLELLQGHDPWVNLTQVCPELASAEPTPDPYTDDYDYDYPGDDTLDINANNQVLLRPIDDYLGVFTHGLLGDLKIVRETERNSLLRMEMGRLLVADLIPTDDAFIFKVAPRVPLADTKEWEKEHVIVFKSTGRVKPPSKSSPAEETTAGVDTDAGGNDVKNDTKEEEVLPYLDQVLMRWELEFYTFERDEQSDSSTGHEEETESTQPEMEQEMSTKSYAVVGDSGAESTTYVRGLAKIAWLLMLCSALIFQF